MSMEVKKFLPICIAILVFITIGLLMIQEGGIAGIAYSDALKNCPQCNNTPPVINVIYNNTEPVKCAAMEPVECKITEPVKCELPEAVKCDIQEPVKCDIPEPKCDTLEKRGPADPSLFVKHNISALPAEKIPNVCVAVLTCRRMHLLKQTIPAFINYFNRVEPNITYEIVVVDNGSGDDYFAEIQREFPVDKLIKFDKNYGIAQGMNTLFFGACAAPYILSVEDDWGARWEEWDLGLPVMAMSMAIMDKDPDVSEIWLREMGHGGAHSNRTGWQDIPAKSGVHPAIKYRRQYRYWKDGQPNHWGAYTNGASLKSRVKLEKVGRMKGVNGEADFAWRVGDMGYAAGMLCYKTTADCDDKYNSEGYSRVEPFAHLGWHNRSSGHKDFGDRRR